jgi:hypothetical protein
MPQPSGSARRSATSAAAAVGVSSLVTGSLLFAAAPAPADSADQHGNSDAHAAPAREKPTESPSTQGPPADHGSSTDEQGTQAHSPQQAANPTEPDRGPEGHAPEQTAHATSPREEAAHPSPPKEKQEEPETGAPADAGNGAPNEHKPSASGHEKSAKPNTDDRPGNQGTIKIDALDFDSHPNNEPHVGCMFQVDFYNYGKGDYNADVGFAQHPPTPGALEMTSGSVTPFIGEDPPGGGTDLDAEETYQLDFSGDPHPKQGYHVKVTVHAPDSLGADTKHKVFWVQPCEETQPPTDEESTPPPPHETTPPDDEDTTTPPGDEETTTPPGEDDTTTPPGDDDTTTPPGDQESVPPVEDDQTTPPVDEGATTPPGDEQTHAAPPLPGQPGSGGPQTVTRPQAGQAPNAQVAPPQAAQPRAAAGGTSAGAAAAAPRAGVPTAVDAGLAGSARSDGSRTAATVLASLGGLLIAAAGVLGRRRRGDHQV